MDDAFHMLTAGWLRSWRYGSSGIPAASEVCGPSDAEVTIAAKDADAGLE